jgi:hypothetical protein
MKRLGVSLFAVVLWFSLAAIAQDTAAQKPAETGQSSTTSKTKSKAGKLEHLKGKISDDGKSLTTDKDNKTYTIENTDAVKGHEGHDVRVSGHVDTSNNSIHVMSVKMAGEKAAKNKKSSPMSEQPPK